MEEKPKAAVSGKEYDRRFYKLKKGGSIWRKLPKLRGKAKIKAAKRARQKEQFRGQR